MTDSYVCLQHVLATAPHHPSLTLPAEGQASDVVSLHMRAFGITPQTKPSDWREWSVSHFATMLSDYANTYGIDSPRAVLLDIEGAFSPFRDFANMEVCARAAEACRQVWGEQVETWLYAFPHRGGLPTGNGVRVTQWRVTQWMLDNPDRITGIAQSLYVKQNREKTDEPWNDLEARRQDVRTSFEVWEGVPLVFVMSHRVGGSPWRDDGSDISEGRLSYVQPWLDCLRVMLDEIKAGPVIRGDTVPDPNETNDVYWWDAAPAGTLTDNPNPLVQDDAGLYEALEILFGEEDGECCGCCEQMWAEIKDLQVIQKAQQSSLDDAATILDNHAKRLRRLERPWLQRVRDRLGGGGE